MKKIFLFFPLLILILFTTIIKNSTKKLDKEIFAIEENIRFLENKLELVLLDYNFLTSPKKLMEYQIKYFENDLIQLNMDDFQKLEIKENQIITTKINIKNE
tara:strand:- start:15756 stop:16061 length:306 start_codon:yes stop_codon:yes gene_type:complete